MKDIAAVSRVKVSADGRGVVSHAGMGLLRELADATGLSAKVTAVLADTYKGPWVHAPGAVFADLAAAVADEADCIDGVGQLCADREHVFGAKASTTTMWRLVDSRIDAAHLPKVREARAAARAAAWTAGAAPPAGQPLYIDMDATLVIDHSDNKQDAAPTWKKSFGHHPLLAFLDHRDRLAAPPRRLPLTAKPPLTTTDPKDSGPRNARPPRRHGRGEHALRPKQPADNGFPGPKPTANHPYEKSRLAPPPMITEEAELRAWLRTFSTDRPRWGWRRSAKMARRAGWAVNDKRIRRLWREEGLRVPQRRRKKRLTGIGAVVGAMSPIRPNVIWAMDFQFDTTAGGRTLKMLNVIDEFTREALAIEVDRAIDADGVVAVLDRLALQLGAPTYVRFDNGPEFVARAVNDWCRFNSAASLFIDPGSPWQNAWIESFDGRLRDELLNAWRFDSLLEARVMIEDWRRDYNANRPHSAHGQLTPTEFALQWTTTHQPQVA